MNATAQPAYPLTFDVDYPDRPLNRMTNAFRLVMLVPIVVVLAALTALGASASDGDSAGLVAVAGLLFVPALLMIVFRGKYPRWWFDWNVELMRFTNRVYAYGALLSDRYPSTDERQYVKLEVEYPDAREDLSRWLPLVKWFLAIPHYLVLAVLTVGALVAVVAAWFSILFTGRYPRALFDYVVGVMRWSNRVSAYAFLLATDKYPPFRLSH
jgi:TRAP-type uncharacterized transport system fused permease subunit